MNTFNWDEDPELNITPLVDIMLVLLAILMVSAPTITYKEEIDLPSGSKSARVLESPVIEIRIDVNKKFYFKDSSFSFAEFADSFILLTNTYKKDSEVRLRADKRLPYGEVVLALKLIKEAGFSKVSLITNE